MTHPLVEQFRFTRAEWLRGLEGLSEDDAAQHIGPMNCISWTVGHFAWHEQKYWLELAQNRTIFPELNQLYAYGAPMSTPSFTEMLEKWRTITREADIYLEPLTGEILASQLLRKGKVVGQSVGSAMLRIIYHYWYHIGEVQAVRQMLGQKNLPEYVGDLENQAPFKPG
jgi:hypothetical protein